MATGKKSRNCQSLAGGHKDEDTEPDYFTMSLVFTASNSRRVN